MTIIKNNVIVTKILFPKQISVHSTKNNLLRMKRRILATVIAFLASFSAIAQITFATAVNIPISGTNSNHLAIGDFNHDGKMDVVCISEFTMGVNDYKGFVFLNTGTALSSTPALYPYSPVYPGARAIAAGDVNGDGYDDYVVGYADSIGIFCQNIFGTMNSQISFQCNSGFYTDAIKIYDVDGDGHKDIVCLSWAGYAVIFYGNGSGSFTKISYTTAACSGYDDVKVGKIGTDSLVSIIEMGGQSWAPIHQVRIHSNRTVDATITLTLGSTNNIHGVAIGNFDGSGNKSIAATYGGNTPTSKLAFWRHPSTTTVADTIINVTDIPQSIDAGIFDCSGIDKAAILHGGWNKVTIAGIGAGAGITTFSVACPNNAEPDALAIVDINGDGKNDVVTVNSYVGMSVLINTTRLRDTTIATTITTTIDTPIRSASSFLRSDTVFIVKTFVIDSNKRKDSTVSILNHCTSGIISTNTYPHRDTVVRTMIDTSAILKVVKNSSYADQTVSGAMSHFKIASWNVINLSSTDTLETYRFNTDIDSMIGFVNTDMYIPTVNWGHVIGCAPVKNTTGAYIKISPGSSITYEVYSSFNIGGTGRGFRISLSVIAKDLNQNITLVNSSVVSAQHIHE